MDGRRLDARPRRSLSLAVALAMGTAGLAVVPTFVGSATAAPVTLAPNADATVAEETPGTNLGTTTELGADMDPRSEAYLRFPSAGLSASVTRATLRLFATGSTKDAPTVHTTSSTWSETGITWENRPAASAGVVADEGAVGSDSWVEYDVTGAVAPNAPSAFVLVAEVPDGIDLASREAAGNRPQLIVEVAAGVPSTQTFPAVADARVEEQNRDANLGTDDTLGVRDETDARIETLLRFNVGGLAGPVTRATLRLFVTGGSANGPAVYQTGAGWEESSVTWANRPSPVGSEADDLGTTERGWAEFDVTGLVTGSGPVNFILTQGSPDSVWARSREGAAAERPELVVQTGSATSTSGPTTTTAPTTTTRPTTTTTTGPDVHCDDSWSDARKVAELPSGRAEMSGMVASTRYPGWGWGIQDSGHPAGLHSFRLGSGGDVDTEQFLVPGAANSDWEDVAYTRTGTGPGDLWVLENIGNGHGGNRRIYQVAEPNPSDPGNATLVNRYDWAYPDAQYNTETLFVFEGDLVVVSKTSPSRVYRFEDGLRTGVVNRPTFVGILPAGSNLSVASVSPDDRFLAVASHSSLYVFENHGTLTDLRDLIADSPVFHESMPKDNRESGGFFPAGSCDIVLVAESKNVWRSSQ